MVKVLAIEQVLQAIGAATTRVAQGAGVHGKEWQVLAWLNERGQLSGGELAELTCRRRQELHRSLQALTRKLLVERINTGDPRRPVYQLTADGDLCLIQIKQMCFGLDQLIGQEFGRELPKFFESLERLRDVIRTGRLTHHGAENHLSPPPRLHRLDVF